MKNTALIVMACLVGCGLTEPTYRDVPPELLEAYAAQLNVSVGEMLVGHRATLRQALSEDFGMQVDKIHVDVDEDGLAAGVVAEIEPALAAVQEAILKSGAKDPTSAGSWATGGVAGMSILGLAVMGLRGRLKRKSVAA